MKPTASVHDRRRWLLAGAGAALGLPWAADSQATTPKGKPAARGEPVSWPEVTLLDGRHFGPAQAAGRAVVVVFWSTSCGFCRRHNQHLEKLHRAAAGSALMVLGVARERDAQAVWRHAQQHGYSFPITVDHGLMAAALASRSMVPLTVTVDRQGRLAEVIPGEMFEDDVLGLMKLVRADKPS